MSVAIGGNYGNNYSLFDVDPAVDAKLPSAKENHEAVSSEGPERDQPQLAKQLDEVLQLWSMVKLDQVQQTLPKFVAQLNELRHQSSMVSGRGQQQLVRQLDAVMNHWSAIPPDKQLQELPWLKRQLGSLCTSNGYENLTGKDAFNQGNQGNCTSIAVIKAAEDMHGDEMFKRKSDGQGGVDATLRNGISVHVSVAELKAARVAADFRGGQGTKAQGLANVAYAVLAKNTAAQRGETYDAALKDLADGENIQDVCNLLGLQHKQIDPSQVGTTDAAIIGVEFGNGADGKTVGFHAQYVDDGKYVDFYGRTEDWKGGGGGVHRATWRGHNRRRCSPELVR